MPSCEKNIPWFESALQELLVLPWLDICSQISEMVEGALQEQPWDGPMTTLDPLTSLCAQSTVLWTLSTHLGMTGETKLFWSLG